ncbi:hypothetical protein ABIA96_002929 [Bradyrhizobium sp. LB11.1]
MDGTASRVISDDAIAPKIVHCSSDFKGWEHQAYGTKPSKII